MAFDEESYAKMAHKWITERDPSSEFNFNRVKTWWEILDENKKNAFKLIINDFKQLNVQELAKIKNELHTKYDIWEKRLNTEGQKKGHGRYQNKLEGQQNLDIKPYEFKNFDKDQKTERTKPAPLPPSNNQEPAPPPPKKQPEVKAEVKTTPPLPVAKPAPFKGVRELSPYHLPNAMVGKAYEEKLDPERLHPGGKIVAGKILGLEDTGLEFVPESLIIRGIPEKAGDPSVNYEFELTLRFETGTKKMGKRTFFLKINPDPRSLWTEVEPPEDLGDPKAHLYHKLIQLDHEDRQRTLFTASKRGRSHARKGTYRDDHTVIRSLAQLGWSIMSVADGAGSAALSRVGSGIACEKAVEFIEKKLTEVSDALDSLIRQLKEDGGTQTAPDLHNQMFLILAHAAFTAAKAIQDEADKRQRPLKDFNTTLLLAIHKRFAFGHFIAGFWIGDGALAIYDGKKEPVLLGQPDGGEYSGQTAFLTMKKYLGQDELTKRVRYHLLEDFTALIAMSDGVSDPQFGTDHNLGDKKYWDRLWEILHEEFKDSDAPDEALLNWLDFWAEGEHDDRSIAILC